MSQSAVLVEIDNGLGHITLNRPEAFNAVNDQLARGLADAALLCQNDQSVRAVVLSGAGRAFCVGGDLKDFANRQDTISEYLEDVTTHLHLAVSRLARMKAPVVVAVQGSAAGGGMSLALACDLMVAGESARFNMAYTRIGLSPDGSASYFLPRIVGMRRAMDLLLTNRTLTAAEAEAWGIVNRVVPDADVVPAARALGQQLAHGSTSAFRAVKRLLHAGWSESLETQMASETREIAVLAGGDDAQEGISAFLEKRAPRFVGGANQ